MENKFLQLNPSSVDYNDTPYPIGIDPIWQVILFNKFYWSSINLEINLTIFINDTWSIFCFLFFILYLRGVLFFSWLIIRSFSSTGTKWRCLSSLVSSTCCLACPSAWKITSKCEILSDIVDKKLWFLGNFFQLTYLYNFSRYFKNQMDVYCLFIPQLIFLVFLFLYMVLLMFLKWMIYTPKSCESEIRCW